MEIQNVGGVAEGPPKTNPLPISGTHPSAQAAQPSKTGSISESSSASASSTTSILFDGSSRPAGNVALALWILNMLLGSSDEEQDGTDLLLLGLMAGLLAAAEHKGPSFFFSSSSHTTASTQTFVGPQEVNAAYNTELPSVAADPTGSAEQTAQTQSVPRIDTSG